MKATLALWTFVVTVQYMIGSSMLLGASYQTFTFARDSALSLSNILYRANSFTGTSINTVWFVVFTAGPLGLARDCWHSSHRRHPYHVNYVALRCIYSPGSHSTMTLSQDLSNLASSVCR
ncbi:hypothetical protein M404DRAFT_1008752 [Pisolithus tinctorius Marx 270]|uniref:Uncharacterized protein n=1 Tax=Pisolithus tinctorius Marx 270 TaxID=870435 RepID=A0A0C3MXZ2_PISTI|nr:hypothetical protein M404DRAFT_1008752 [Pisolithus tinctorius Marx 270]